METVPARDFVDSLDDKAAARIDAFIDRLRVYGNRMQGKFVKKLTNDIFELRVKRFDQIFRGLFFYQPGMVIVITSGFQKKTEQTPVGEITRAECQPLDVNAAGLGDPFPHSTVGDHFRICSSLGHNR